MPCVRLGLPAADCVATLEAPGGSAMKTRIVQIGNSQGIRIPKPLLQQTGLHGEVVIVAPMTTKGPSYPTRVQCRFKGKDGQVVLDQIRTVDRVRLIKKLGRLDNKTSARVLEVLQEMFGP